MNLFGFGMSPMAKSSEQGKWTSDSIERLHSDIRQIDFHTHIKFHLICGRYGIINITREVV